MKRGGFTIIELLVVITIIGILSTLATTSYLAAQSRSRDTARKTTVNTIAGALETYYTQRQSFPGDDISPTGSKTISDANQQTCESVTNFTNGGYSPYYFYQQPASSCSQISNQNEFQQSGDWLPGLDSYLSPIPSDPRFMTTGGNSSVSPAASDQVKDYMDSTANDQQNNQTRTIIYRNLSTTDSNGNTTYGYAIYARLENADDTDFSKLFTMSGGTASLNDDAATGGDLPYLPAGLNTISESSSNPITVYMVRK